MSTWLLRSIGEGRGLRLILRAAQAAQAQLSMVRCSEDGHLSLMPLGMISHKARGAGAQCAKIYAH